MSLCVHVHQVLVHLSDLLQNAPVWEITGAEFSKSEMHTADGISIRFPRMTRVRDDKDWKTATNLHQLKVRNARAVVWQFTAVDPFRLLPEIEIVWWIVLRKHESRLNVMLWFLCSGAVPHLEGELWL